MTAIPIKTKADWKETPQEIRQGAARMLGKALSPEEARVSEMQHVTNMMLDALKRLETRYSAIEVALKPVLPHGWQEGDDAAEQIEMDAVLYPEVNTPMAATLMSYLAGIDAVSQKLETVTRVLKRAL